MSTESQGRSMDPAKVVGVGKVGEIGPFSQGGVQKSWSFFCKSV